MLADRPHYSAEIAHVNVTGARNREIMQPNLHLRIALADVNMPRLVSVCRVELHAPRHLKIVGIA